MPFRCGFVNVRMTYIKLLYLLIECQGYYALFNVLHW